ncbi:MAG: S9 family peptidase, partial [Bacteroidota bacterium]
LNPQKVLHATFSPDATKVAFVKDNNIYVKDIVNEKTTQITTDGKTNSIINGNCDWVYEEEFGFTRAFQWSKKGNYIAYYRFDESAVPSFTFPVYKDSIYPENYTYKYPKVGEQNSTVDIYVYDLNKGTNLKMDIGNEKDIYISRIQFTEDDSKLCITHLNRLQNEQVIFYTDVTNGRNTILYEETNKAYVDVNKMRVDFLKDGKSFIYTSEKNGYNHIYLQNINTKKTIQLTAGNFDVDEIIGVDEKKAIVYFTAAYRSPLVKDFCSVHLDGKGFALNDLRIGRHTISFNSDFTYYTDSYSDINTPPFTAIYDSHGKQVRVLADNNKLKQTLADYALGNTEFIKVVNTIGDTLNGLMIKPKDFDINKKYPVLFSNYGGPGSQTVYNGWGSTNMWQQMLTQKGYIIVSIDNTGTGFRGEAFKKKTYLQLGKYEIEDQIDAAKYIATLPYVDANRIGHWGWSFGGFMSCLAITKGADIFKTAIAVAPVTDWQYYDDIYTERYMRTQKENAKGYHDNAPLSFVKNIKGKLLIIHGTADDNVHFQNSAMFVDAMINNNIEFESAYYPNKNHGIRGGNTRLHLYNKMTKFILQNL